MRGSTVFLTGLALLGTAGVAQAAPLKFPRHPALSPDGRNVAFDWGGDIWVAAAEGGAARRLTTHPAADRSPVFSPDGQRIAFTSWREGNPDVYVVSLDGDEPTRLTWHSGGDYAQGFSADGKFVIFTSRRSERVLSWMPTVYQVPVGGGMAVRLMAGEGDQVSVSSSGTVVFVRGDVDWWRQRYRGSANEEVWTYDPATKAYESLTAFQGCDRFPHATSAGLIYYVTDSDGHFNLFSMEMDGRDKTRRTEFKDAGIRFVGVAADGSRAMIEKDGGFLLMDLPSGTPRPVAFSGSADTAENPVEWMTFSSKATQGKVAPDGAQAAFIVRGELFAVETREDGATRRLSESAARETDPVWFPDGKAVLFVSDRDGQRDLYQVKSADPKESKLARALKLSVTRLTSTPDDESSPLLSPDGKVVYFVRGKGDVIRLDLASKAERTLFSDWTTPEMAVSPDGQWLAVAREDANFNSDIWLVKPADPSFQAVNITQHPDNDFSPSFSPDGKMLAFASRRFNEGATDIWAVYLRKADHIRTEDDWAAEAANKKDALDGAPSEAAPANDKVKDKGGAKDKADEKDDKKPEPVVIDLEGIQDRLRRITSFAGDETGPLALKDRTFLFVSSHEGESDLYSVKMEDLSDVSALTKGGKDPSSLSLTKDGKTVYFVGKGGSLQKVGADGKDQKGVPFAARMDVNKREERRQMFMESWRTMRDWFYDPQYHGVDFRALKDVYLPQALEAVDREDFLDTVRMLLGELNASHQGIYDRSAFGGGGARATGEPGVTWDEAFAGPGFRVHRVLPDTPAAAAGLKPGDVLVAVNGQPASSAPAPEALFAGTVGERTLLAVRGTDNTEREVVLRPISTRDFRDRIYDEWIRQRRSIVHRASGGKLGYIHIRGMSLDNVDKFERDLYAEANGRQGLLIDVRYNGGGWTTDYLLAILQARPHAFTVARDGEHGYPQDRLPLSSWQKPSAVLCNEFSFSNAEIFSHAFKNLGLGPVVGRPTYGGVISTGAVELIDGTTLRLPFRGWYTLPAGENMENKGCAPDIDLANLPGDDWDTTDRQLDAAVGALLKRIENQPAR